MKDVLLLQLLKLQPHSQSSGWQPPLSQPSFASLLSLFQLTYISV